MQFTSPFKQLVVKFGHGEAIKFDGGKAEVEGDLARKLADFAERDTTYGIEADGEVEPEVDDPYKGKKESTLRKQAEARGVELPEDADRDAVVEALKAADAEDTNTDE